MTNTNWTLAAVDFKGGPFIGVNPDETRTVYASAETGTGITITASAAIFTANHVGSLFLIEQKKTDTVLHWEVGKAIAVAGLERRNGGNVYLSGDDGTTGTAQPVHLEGSRYDGDNGVRWLYLHSGYGVVKMAIGGGGTTATADVVAVAVDVGRQRQRDDAVVVCRVERGARLPVARLLRSTASAALLRGRS